MIGEVERLVDQPVEVDLATLAGHPARVLQHALHDVVGALAMLGDLFQVAREQVERLANRSALRLIERRHCGFRCFRQLFEQLDGQAGEVVDEVERVLDLVGDPGG